MAPNSKGKKSSRGKSSAGALEVERLQAFGLDFGLKTRNAAYAGIAGSWALQQAKFVDVQVSSISIILFVATLAADISISHSGFMRMADHIAKGIPHEGELAKAKTGVNIMYYLSSGGYALLITGVLLQLPWVKRLLWALGPITT